MRFSNRLKVFTIAGKNETFYLGQLWVNFKSKIVSFNLNPVNGAVTFVVDGRLNLKNIVELLEETLMTIRTNDELLRDTGFLDEYDFYSNELAYCRTECIILKLKRGLPPYAVRSSSHIL